MPLGPMLVTVPRSTALTLEGMAQLLVVAEQMLQIPLMQLLSRILGSDSGLDGKPTESKRATELASAIVRATASGETLYGALSWTFCSCYSQSGMCPTLMIQNRRTRAVLHLST